MADVEHAIFTLQNQIADLKLQVAKLSSPELKHPAIIACDSAIELGKEIALLTGYPLIKTETTYFANGETRVTIKESVRDRDLFLVATGFQRGGHSLNDAVAEMKFMMRTCRRSDSRSITLILPHYPYARQDKKDTPRAAISAADIAEEIVAAGANRIICVDLHNACIQGFTTLPFDNLYGSIVLKPFLLETIFGNDPDYAQKYVVVSPDEGGFKRATKYAAELGMDMIAMIKTRENAQRNVVSKCVIHGNPENLKGRTAIILDDMCDTAGTAVAAAKTLKEHGAKDVILCVTHGLLSGPGCQRIRDCNDISMLICSDSVPQGEHAVACQKIDEQGSKLRVFSLAPLLADVVHRLCMGKSLSDLFN